MKCHFIQNKSSICTKTSSLLHVYTDDDTTFSKKMLKMVANHQKNDKDDKDVNEERGKSNWIIESSFTPEISS